jgi:hypothetical protein
MVILRRDRANRMVTKDYRKGVYKWVGGIGEAEDLAGHVGDLVAPQKLSSRAKHDLSEAKTVRSRGTLRCFAYRIVANTMSLDYTGVRKPDVPLRSR